MLQGNSLIMLHQDWLSFFKLICNHKCNFPIRTDASVWNLTFLTECKTYGIFHFNIFIYILFVSSSSCWNILQNQISLSFILIQSCLLLSRMNRKKVKSIQKLSGMKNHAKTIKNSHNLQNFNVCLVANVYIFQLIWQDSCSILFVSNIPINQGAQ